MAITDTDFREGMSAFKEAQLRNSKSAGPSYCPDGGIATFYDQIFEADFEPAGSVDCKTPLHVGRTHNGLDIALVANPNNEGPIVIPAGSTITLCLKQADTADGTFEDIGPEVCVKAPAGGKTAKPGHVITRFAIGDFDKPWIMVSLEFAGSITGGKVDCVLAYMPR